MAKLHRISAGRKAGDKKIVLPDQVEVSLVELAGKVRQGLLAFSVGVGLEVIRTMMNEDAKSVVGERAKWNPDRTAHRHGTERSSLTLGGRKVVVDKPRVRSVGGEEIHLPTRGRVVSQKDRNGKITSLDYALAGVVATSYTDSAGGSRTTRAETDWIARATKYTDELGTTTRAAFDQASRVVSTHRSGLLGLLESQVTSIAYDGAGRVSKLTDHLSAVPRATDFTYDDAGRLLTISRPNGITSTNSYSAGRGWLDSISHKDGSAELSAWSYSRSPSGNVAQETGAGRTRAFTYDGAARLTKTVQTGASAATRNYAYDANSNRCSQATACDGSFVYDAADRIVSSPFASSYSYDSHGNMVSADLIAGASVAEELSIAYDGNDHATVTNDGKSSISETLSPSGRVLRRTVTDLETGLVTEDTVFGFEGPGDSPAYSRPAAGGPTTTYLQGPNGLLVTDVAGVASYPLSNGHGDIVGATDIAGGFTLNPDPDEFGKGQPPADRLGWLGEKQRYSTGGDLRLVRMGVRLYDPALGRFLSVDPVPGGSANDFDYANQDCANQFDLDGRNAVSRLLDRAAGSKWLVRYNKCMNTYKKVSNVYKEMMAVGSVGLVAEGSNRYEHGKMNRMPSIETCLVAIAWRARRQVSFL